MASLKLLPTKLQNAEHYRTIWGVVVDPGTTLEDIQRAEYWSHVAPRLSRMDKVEVLTEDGEYYAELLVIGTGTGWAKVLLTKHIAFEGEAEPDIESPVKAEWKGPARKWAVVRKSDGVIVADGMPSRHDAETAAIQYVRTIQQAA